jgi:hypothetical protein
VNGTWMVSNLEQGRIGFSPDESKGYRDPVWLSTTSD